MMRQFWGLAVLLVGGVLAAERPNILFLLSDDQHWDETSVQMHPDYPGSRSQVYETPHLEALAAEGMRFSDAYAPSPVCVPTRISLQTGKTPAQLHWTKAGPSLRASGNPMLLPPVSKRAITPEQVTIAECLKQAGYRTAHYGKWHLSGGGPEAHGYDESDGDVGNEASSRYRDPNPTDIFGMTSRAVDFMKRSQSAGKPFFIQLSYLALHSPENASAKNIAKFKAKGAARKDRALYRQALTADLDEGVGQLMAELKALGLSDNTYVVYMSDNGARSRGAGSITGNKGSLGEGGVRAVFIVKGPGVRQGGWCQERVVGYDLFPTFCGFAGVKAPEGLAGGDLRSCLFGEGSEVVRSSSELTFHFPHYQDTSPVSSIYVGDYKLLYSYESQSSVLYNVKNDIGEKTNLARQMPEKVAVLEAKLHASLKAQGAQLPTINTQYDPSQPSQSGKKRKR